MSTPYDTDRPSFTPADQAPTQTFVAGSGYVQPEQPAGNGFTQANRDADETAQFPRVQEIKREPVGNGYGGGWTPEERAARRAKDGSLGNWFMTGDKHVDKSDKSLAPAEYDAFSISGLILAFFVPIAGIILSIVSFAEAKKNHRRTHWTGITGFIVGALGCLAWTLYWVVVIMALVAVTNAVNNVPTGG